MAILSNVEIEKYIQSGKIKINPYNPKNVQGATVDFGLKDEFLIPQYYNNNGISLIKLNEKFPHEKKILEKITILPNHFILGTTLEKLTLPNDLCARIDGKSKIGRKGLIVQTAGHLGPGFSGEITLELFNSAQIPIEINYKDLICQIEFHELSSPSTKPYRGRFFNQSGPRI